MPWSPAARRAFIPYGVLVIALILTAMAAYYSASAARTRDRLRFENVADRVKSAIDSRLDAYVAMLLAGTNRTPLLAILEDQLHRGRRPKLIVEALRVRPTAEQVAILQRWEDA